MRVVCTWSRICRSPPSLSRCNCVCMFVSGDQSSCRLSWVHLCTKVQKQRVKEEVATFRIGRVLWSTQQEITLYSPEPLKKSITVPHNVFVGAYLKHYVSFKRMNLFLARVPEPVLLWVMGSTLEEMPAQLVHGFRLRFLISLSIIPQWTAKKRSAFLSKRHQFAMGKISTDRTIYKLRYICEVSSSRVTKTKGLHITILFNFSLLTIRDTQQSI